MGNNILEFHLQNQFFAMCGFYLRAATIAKMYTLGAATIQGRLQIKGGYKFRLYGMCNVQHDACTRMNPCMNLVTCGGDLMSQNIKTVDRCDFGLCIAIMLQQECKQHYNFGLYVSSGIQHHESISVFGNLCRQLMSQMCATIDMYDCDLRLEIVGVM